MCIYAGLAQLPREPATSAPRGEVRLHAYQRNGIASARSFLVREFRSELLRRAREPLSCEVVNRLREMVKRELETTEQLRLDRWHQGKD